MVEAEELKNYVNKLEQISKGDKNKLYKIVKDFKDSKREFNGKLRYNTKIIAAETINNQYNKLKKENEEVFKNAEEAPFKIEGKTKRKIKNLYRKFQIHLESTPKRNIALGVAGGGKLYQIT